MNPLAWALASNWVVSASNAAPSARPWRSTTRGMGPAPASLGGGVTGYQRSTPSTVMSWRCSVTAAAADVEVPADVEQPGDGTGGPELARVPPALVVAE